MKPLLSSKNPLAWLLKAGLAAVLGALVLKNAGGATINDFTNAIASIPFVWVLAIEFFDKISDRFDYVKWSAKALYGTTKADVRGTFKALAVGAVFAALAFLGVLYLATGTITFAAGTYSPGVLAAAAVVALYIIAPETGDDELMLYLWLAATLATGGAHFTLLGPAFSSIL